MDKYIHELPAFIGVLLLLGTCGHVGAGPCEQGSCYPATGDLLIGREMNLTASSTCGLEQKQRYCVVSYLEKDTKCFFCDSRQPWVPGVSDESHRIENIISSLQHKLPTRWWQAETGKEKVSIQLDLEAEFHVTHIIMTFKTFRPKAMLIERSFDFGATWQVYVYFAQSCDRSFPNVPKGPAKGNYDVICDESYSAETPSSYGEVIFKVLRYSGSVRDPYGEKVQNLLKLTNLRINFTELHTLGDTLLDTRPEVKEKYYYALSNVVIRGSCSCYGHASRCVPVPGYNRSEESIAHMVHGKCECTHNTKGHNCEACEDFYHDIPWGPSRINKPYVCKKCNCNDHATSCHFDAALFKASGEKSGGVCDNCMHNTQGINCQECRPFFYQDPTRDIRDPEICQPCDCDSYGSQRNGLCEQTTDEIAKTVAGRCLCKPFVAGPRCDRCIENYWNLRQDNPLGCEPCTCNPNGTVPDVGCDIDSGLCRCKRYVTGKDCDRCYPGYYQLSRDNRYGCKPCHCDIGASLSFTCDYDTGKCPCRPNIRGRDCKEVDPGYFFAHLDHYLFEAEYGKGSGNARIYAREPITGHSYWTGLGYMRVMEGDSIEFTVSGLPLSINYDIVIRYDPRMPETFEDVKVTVIRPGQVDPNGLCGDYRPRDDLKTVSLPPGTRYYLVSPPSCLEDKTTYTIRIDFNAYKSGQSNPDATLLIDSIVLVPNTESIPIYQGRGLPEYMKNEFLYHRCDTAQYSSYRQTLQRNCPKHIFSISAILHNGALACECDVTGSVSLECNPSGGQCECKPNVVGRKCDQCAPGTYGFGPNGCTPCNCHEFGARDKFCNEQTGQCTCNQNIGGRACDQCKVGFWGFPQCRACQCNGNAETCDPLTGVCINCRDFTAGDNCQSCDQGYYGDPRIGVRVPCKPCMCPNGPTSSIQHANSCSYDPRYQEVYCNCNPGYSGRNCETCIENYYGNPTVIGGVCQPCVCNNNINVDDPGSCNGLTGECLKCLYNTEGFACEHCRNGYFGDATKQNCARCVCHSLGTNSSLGECDRDSGQCPCFPNVIGQKCDQCSPAHWNINSKQGCTACDCDPSGSTSLECNQFTGQCNCLDGRGGPKCADCEDFFYGDPTEACFPCDCNKQGSTSLQCDRRTGQCSCVAGVTGYKCDRCARGTTGDLPNCVPCGECFDNWDKIIMELQDQTHDLVKRANEVSVTGAIKAFDEEFKLMEHNIEEIRNILSNVNFTQFDIQETKDLLKYLNANLTEGSLALRQLDTNLTSSKIKIMKEALRVDMIENRIKALANLAAELRNNATNIQIQEIGGAFEKIKEAEQESKTAQQRVDDTAKYISQSQQLRAATEKLLDDRKESFNDQLKENAQALDSLHKDVEKIGEDLSDINNMVCGVPGNPCSALCGGGGCGKCGGESCFGAVTSANSALKLVQTTEDLLNNKIKNATQHLIPAAEMARQDANEAKQAAQEALEEAQNANSLTQKTKSDLEDLNKKIRDFLIGANTSTPENVEKIANEVLSLRIPWTPDEIKQLAEKINVVVDSLQNIDKILADTAENRSIAENLKQQADKASTEAKAIRKNAEEVKNALDEAKQVQLRAEMAIQKAKEDIKSAEMDLTLIGQEAGNVSSLSTASEKLLEMLKDSLEQLTRKYTNLKVDTLEKAEKAASDAARSAEKAFDKASEFNKSYDAIANQLNGKYNLTGDAKQLSDTLKMRADKIYRITATKTTQLKAANDKIAMNEARLSKVQEEINKLNSQMDAYIKTIKERSNTYVTC
ncbi:laminin subunit beta-1-like [Physella acuta]|uniref:laminin subunit beta-1-like n=1 Tax=Physella acuta TaxID=109671 RepID=UPI0027DC8154|nr:laminin subunit beta-1-like [Physella acuta]